MPRGGKRQGKPGTAYSNRTDLMAQPVRTAPSQTYGEGVAQQRAQQAIPLPQQPPPGQGPSMPMPPQLDAGTQRPGEPLTAGVPGGPGPGPEALVGNPGQLSPLDELRAMYRLAPFDELRKLIQYAESNPE